MSEWKLVPVEPTEAMIDAAAREVARGIIDSLHVDDRVVIDGQWSDAPIDDPRAEHVVQGRRTAPARIYAAMLAAAPDASAVQEARTNVDAYLRDLENFKPSDDVTVEATDDGCLRFSFDFSLPAPAVQDHTARDLEMVQAEPVAHIALRDGDLRCMHWHVPLQQLAAGTKLYTHPPAADPVADKLAEAFADLRRAAEFLDLCRDDLGSSVPTGALRDGVEWFENAARAALAEYEQKGGV